VISSNLSPADWHQRFSIQASWTAELRRYIFPNAGIANAKRLLEVGCGTGVLLKEIDLSIQHSEIQLYGLDIDRSFLRVATHKAANSKLAEGDAVALPYVKNCFDISFCHYLLLWVSDPVQTIKEMLRVTLPGGSVLALAEPDYGGRLDSPESLFEFRRLQEIALFRQGANSQLGRRLGEIFHEAGCSQIETGVLGGRWSEVLSKTEWESEWNILLQDFGDSLPISEINRFHRLYRDAWQTGTHLLFIPTFYAWGRVEP
jgi:SAM-dependent methyltransferase